MAVHAVRRLSVKRDSTVVICGLGTIGQLFIMFLMEHGVKTIYVVGSKDAQKKVVSAMGISERNFSDNSKEDALQWLFARTNNRGALPRKI